jgi:arabinose-5-phosphate isomerase
LAPTTSTTTTLVIGDALALCLLKKRNFKSEDFALLHPGGSLGRKLSLSVEDVMHKGNLNPIIKETASMKDALFEITSKHLGAVSVVDQDNKLVGIITDGDVRRLIEEREAQILNKSIFEVMTKNPVCINKNKLGTEALHLMEDRKFQISVLSVVDDDKKVVGMVRVHDLIKAGIS